MSDDNKKKKKKQRVPLPHNVPVVEALLEMDTGKDLSALACAAVWGKVFLYCLGERHRYDGRVGRLAKELNIGRSTVKRALKVLCERGYLEVRLHEGQPSYYWLTTKVWDEAEMAAPKWVTR